jgi:hypothetical protein
MVLDAVKAMFDIMMDVISHARFRAHSASIFSRRLDTDQVNRGAKMVGQLGSIFKCDRRRG